MSKELITALGDWPGWISIRSHEPPSPLKVVLKGDPGYDTQQILQEVVKKGIGLKLVNATQIVNHELKRVVVVLTFPEWVAKALLAKAANAKPAESKAPSLKAKAPVKPVKAILPPEPLNPFASNPPDGWCSSWPRAETEARDTLQEAAEERFGLIELY